MENPPEGGEQGNRKKIVKKAIGWLMLQALSVWVRHLIEKSL